MSDLYECVRVIMEALQLRAVYKKLLFFASSHATIYQYYKSCENLYQVLGAGYEIEGSYDKIIITIVPSYAEKISLACK